MTTKKPFNIWVEKQADESIEDFRYAVVQEGAVVGRFIKEAYALVMADTLLRAELVHELGSDVVNEILALLVDQIADLRARRWISSRIE